MHFFFQIHDIRKRDPVATLQNPYQITAVTFNDTAEHVIGGGIDNDIKVILSFQLECNK